MGVCMCSYVFWGSLCKNTPTSNRNDEKKPLCHLTDVPKHQSDAQMQRWMLHYFREWDVTWQEELTDCGSTQNSKHQNKVVGLAVNAVFWSYNIVSYRYFLNKSIIHNH